MHNTALEIPTLDRLNKDLRAAATTLSDVEARYLVDSYYQMQDNRIRSDNQVRSMEGEPNLLLSWLANNADMLENSIKTALQRYAQARPIGEWLMSNHGIGPVISAGLMAHIDIRKADTAAKIWRFAGQDPSTQWLGKAKAHELVSSIEGKEDIINRACILANRNPENFRKWLARNEEKESTAKLVKWLSQPPYNPTLKTLCWKIGQSFMKFHNDEKCFYGKMYREHKTMLEERSEAGFFKDYCLEKSSKVGKATEAHKQYKEGKLPKGQIDARARRYAVKMFLAHIQQVWWETETSTPCVVPYAIAHLGHKDYIAPPNYTPLKR